MKVFLPLISCSESDAWLLQNHAIIIIPRKFRVLKTIGYDNEFGRGEDSLTAVYY